MVFTVKGMMKMIFGLSYRNSIYAGPIGMFLGFEGVCCSYLNLKGVYGIR